MNVVAISFLPPPTIRMPPSSASAFQPGRCVVSPGPQTSAGRSTVVRKPRCPETRTSSSACSLVCASSPNGSRRRLVFVPERTRAVVERHVGAGDVDQAFAARLLGGVDRVLGAGDVRPTERVGSAAGSAIPAACTMHRSLPRRPRGGSGPRGRRRFVRRPEASASPSLRARTRRPRAPPPRRCARQPRR